MRSLVEPAPAVKRPRVLVVRSSRAPQFLAGVQIARARHPEAEIVVLSHRGHRDLLVESGADTIIEVPGSRFGLFRTPPWTLWRLRAAGFTEVVVPQMHGHPDVYVNLYWILVALRMPRVLIVPGEDEPLVFDRTRFLPYVLQHSCTGFLNRFDAVTFVALLAAACLVKRPRPEPAQGRRRRVLHIISSLGVGGAQVQLAEVLNRTPREQYDVELLVLGHDDGEFSRQWLTGDDVSVSYLEQWPRLTLAVREVIERCRSGRYDLVHTWLFMANMVGAAGARLAGVPVVIASVRNLSVWKREAWYRKWWFRIGDILGSHAADMVTVNAGALVADHSRWAWLAASRMEVVYNGLNPDTCRSRSEGSRQMLLALTRASGDASFVGTVGRLAPEKDQATFLRILGRVVASGVNVHGVVVGDGAMRSSLERLAIDLGIADRVTFLGSRADARRLVAGLDLFVLTSVSEGFPNVLLEATFMAVPCIATRIAGNPDVLPDDACLFPAGDVDAGTRAVLDALADDEGARARAAAMRTRALDLFTSERSVARWMSLYDQAFDRAAPVAPGRREPALVPETR